MSLLPLPDEKKLLFRIAKRDVHAFKTVYDHYGRKVYGHCKRLLHTEVLAEEALQEIFLKIWLMEDRLLQIDHLDAYLKVLSRNHCLNVIRRQALEERTNARATADYTDAHNETEETILLRDARALLDEAIEALPDQQREVYRLCQREGLTYDQAAQQLGISVNTVKTHMKRALASLRTKMEQHGKLPILMVIFNLF